MATALVTQIAYAVQTLFDPAGTAGRLVDLGKLANYGLLTSFTPAALFTTGVNGAWYDPSDLNTLFQDAAGTTPVTAVGQPVGLVLDKSKGLVLGGEKIVNGNGTSLTGWSNGNNWWVVSNGRFYHAASSAYNELSQTFTTTQGVKISFDYEVVSGVAEFFYVKNDNSVITNTLTGIKTFTAILPAGIKQVGFNRSSGSTAAFYIDNISVRELPGNHAYNPSGNSANFPVLSARYNLLTKTEDFGDAVWAKSNSTVTANAIIAPDGTLTADKLVEDNTNNTHNIRGTTVTSGIYKASIYIKAAGRHIAQIAGLNSVNDYAIFNLSTATVSASGPGASNPQISAVGDGWFRCSVTMNFTSLGMVVALGANPTAGWLEYYTGNGTSGIYIWGADLRVANDALNQPAYQRVNTSTDYDTVGFKPYLSFNGVNQWLQTNSIDFTYGDKMFVSAGVRKLSDANGIFTELSANINTNNGAFYIAIPPTAGTFEFSSKGTTPVVISRSGFAVPISAVVSLSSDIAAPKFDTKVNTIASVTSTTTQGTGNCGNYPLYIGARGGASLFFNGRLYGLVVAGKAASDSEIASTEAWLNQKTGAY